MRKSSTELKVGIFAIIVILILSYMTFKVGRLPLLWEKGYKLYVVFDDISGLDEKSRIKIAGVESGIVDKIKLENGKARLTLLINPDVKIYKNARAYLRMTGLLGDKYIALSTGTSDKPILKHGDTIIYTVPAADIDMLANQLTSAATYISDLINNIRDILGEAEREAIKESVYNLRIVTRNLKEISTENKQPFSKIIAQLEDFTGALSSKGPGILDDISEIVRNINDKGPALMDDLRQTAKTLKVMVEENRFALKEGMESFKVVSKSMGNITKRIEKGEGTLGKLVKDNKLYDSLSKVSEEAGKSLDVIGRLRTFMDFHTEYNTNEAEWKGYFDLTLQPKRDKYYILGIVSDPRGSVETTDTTINNITTTEEEVKSKIEFTAQFAKRFEDFSLRVGLMENTFGFGTDYFFHNDRGRLKFDIWDLSAKEADAEKLHAKVGVDYRLFKFIFVSAGIDNLLNSNRTGIYIGGGVKFEDEDFKYLFGRSPTISLP